jgi:hypothetical protein
VPSPHISCCLDGYTSANFVAFFIASCARRRAQAAPPPDAAEDVGCSVDYLVNITLKTLFYSLCEPVYKLMCPYFEELQSIENALIY